MVKPITSFLANACALALFVAGFHAAADNGPASPASSIVSFRSGKVTLKGYLFKPPTPGRHPVMLWNHGSPKPLLQFGDVSRFDALANFFLQRDFVLFIPDRRVREVHYDDASAGDAGDQETIAAEKSKLKELLERNHSDFRAAIDWLKSQPYVEKTKIFAGGYSSGATLSIYEAGMNSDIRGFVLFGPGSMQWNKSPFLREMMLHSVRSSKAPLFIAQAQNDFHLQAISALGKELIVKGKPNATVVYPPYGKSQKEANTIAMTGIDVWRDDVAEFLQAALQN